jgi:integrase/recombinase XerD
MEKLAHMTDDYATGNSSQRVARIPIEEIERQLKRRYEAKGWSRHLWVNDVAHLRRLAKHPEDVTIEDCEDLILKATKNNTRSNYMWLLTSIYRTMNELGIVDNNPTLKLPVIRKTRNHPRPLTDREAATLLSMTNEPMRSWFVLGCFAGLRAMEVSGLTGADLEQTDDGFTLRVRGKGKTDLVIPAHPLVAEIIQKQGRLGRLWNLNPNKISAYACEEMRRVGVDKKFHSCRHYFATSALKASGGDLLVVRDLLRHASVATTQQYTALEQSRPTSVVNLLQVPTYASA